MLFYNRISRVPKGFAASAFFLQLKSVHRSGYTGRLTNDAVKTMEGETSIMEGGRTEEADRRRGDFAAMAIDPVDDCTFWYTNKYYQRSKSRNTRIASFKFAPCNSSPPPVSLSQTSVIFPAQLVGMASSPQPVSLTNNQTTC